MVSLLLTQHKAGLCAPRWVGEVGQAEPLPQGPQSRFTQRNNVGWPGSDLGDQRREAVQSPPKWSGKAAWRRWGLKEVQNLN